MWKIWHLPKYKAQNSIPKLFRCGRRHLCDTVQAIRGVGEKLDPMGTKNKVQMGKLILVQHLKEFFLRNFEELIGFLQNLEDKTAQ